jgi:2-methylisocitrate lyase-like PEP mutase family enzyme
MDSQARAAQLRRLHTAPKLLVLVNVWDAMRPLDEAVARAFGP